MRILLVLDYYLPHAGGTETMFANLVEQYAAQGHTVHIFTSQHDSTLATYEQVSSSIHIYRKGGGRKGLARYSRRHIPRLIKKHHYHIIHASVYAGAPAAIFWAKRYKIPCILTVHEIFGALRYHYKKGVYARLHHQYEKLLVQYTYPFIHCVSVYTYNCLRIHYGIQDTRMKVIHNGVNTSRSPHLIKQNKKAAIQKKFGIKQGNIYLLYYGHSGISKGIDYLIQALPTIFTKHPNVHIIFNLIHAQRDQYIRKQIKKIGHQSRIHLSGGMVLEDLQHLVASVQAVIAPSLSEGFGSVHNETTSIGTPLITTKVGPLPEVLGGTIYRAQPGSTESLVQAIDLFLENYNNGTPHPSYPRQTHTRSRASAQLLKLYRTMTHTSQSP